jgi:twitching motility protein PilT
VTVYESDLSRLVDELNRTKLGLKTDKKTSLDTLLALAAEQNASDIILVAGSAITLRVNGSLAPPIGKVLTAEEIRSLLLPR